MQRAPHWRGLQKISPNHNTLRVSVIVLMPAAGRDSWRKVRDPRGVRYNGRNGPWDKRECRCWRANNIRKCIRFACGSTRTKKPGIGRINILRCPFGERESRLWRFTTSVKQMYKDEEGFLFTLRNIRHQMAEKMANARAKYYGCERSFKLID